MGEIVIKVVNMPLRIKGFTVPDGANDDFVVILNARLSAETQMKVLKHEIKHIESGHFDYSYSNEIILEH